MKKLIFSAIAICGFMAVNAQSNISNGVNPTDIAGNVISTAAINLTLHNAMEITPDAIANDYNTTFKTVADYNGAAKTMGSRAWNIKSTRGGTVSISLPDLTETGVSGTPQVIPVSKMACSVNGAAFAVATSTVSAGTFGAGAVNPISLALKVHPGWGFEGGVYSGTVTVTATQL